MIVARQVPFINFKTAAFFDSDIVKNSLDKVTRRALIMAAVDVKRQAKKSMKARPPGEYAPRGTPPFKHKHSTRGKKSGRDYGLERSIMYAYDMMSQSAVIGPSTVYGANIADIGTRHEFGGSIVRKNPRRRLRKLGGAGEIRVNFRALKIGVYLKRDAKGRFLRADQKLRMATYTVADTRMGEVEVTYGKLFTREQVRRANAINARLYGPAIIHGKYPQRAFMRPSLEKIAPRLPEYFDKAVK